MELTRSESIQHLNRVTTIACFGRKREMGTLTRSLLLTGTAMPVLYFLALFTAGSLYPDYSHIRQVASDLGAVGAPY